MKLNLHIIKEELTQEHYQSHLISPPYELDCEYAMICNTLPDVLSSEILYICPAAALPASSDSKITLHFICTGMPDTKWFMSPCEFLWTDASIDATEIMNQVSLIYYKYSLWEASLQKCLDEQVPLIELAKCSSHLIKNAIYLQGAAFRAIFTYYPQVSHESELYRDYKKNFSVPENTTLPTEDINYLISDSEYNHAISATEPSIYSGVLYGFRSLFYNIRANQAFIARITVDEVIAPLTDRDYALIKVLGDYLGKGLQRENNYVFNRPVDLDDILKNLLVHHLLPEERINSVIRHFHWSMEDTYVCIILKLNTLDNTSSALMPMALALADALKNDCYTIHDNHIVFICNLTQKHQDKKILLADIIPMLRDNLLTAALSAPYHDFKDLYYYYCQAIFAESAGGKKDSTKWYFHFEDYALDYVLSKCSRRSTLSVYIPEGLLRLQVHDREKGLNDTHTLRIYLENERNIAETIRILYMHRNTFLYRIKKIEEILQMDLNDPHVRFLLQFAFLMMDADL